MILELDAGNTRIKWRLRQKQDSGWMTVAADSVFAQQKTPSVFIELGKQLDKLPIQRIDRLLVASVRGEGFKPVFVSLMTEKWHLQPEFAVPSASFAGLHNGYVEPGALGVDRWLALVAAWVRSGKACCVVDCGTTITIDVVTAEGRHLGGYIVPGLHVMRDSLAHRSRALSTAASAWDSPAPGTTTLTAVHNGLLAMALGVMRSIRQDCLAAGHQLEWFSSGGDAHVLAPHLDWQYRLESDLVMEGLELVMLQPES